MKVSKVQIIVLNYQGEKLLQKHLPSIITAAQQATSPTSVTILDNESTDSSKQVVQEQFPTARWIPAPKNLVLCSYNDYVASQDDDIVILLNNDVSVSENFVDPLIHVFEKYDDAFFVSAHNDRSYFHLRSGVITADLIEKKHPHLLNQFGINFSTGMAAFHRKRFVELGGYDEMYLPGRYEDVDLCYRAFRCGWKGYYEPESTLHHDGGASFDRFFSDQSNQRLVFRNGILFMAKNINYLPYALSFIILTPLRCLYYLITLRPIAALGNFRP